VCSGRRKVKQVSASGLELYDEEWPGRRDGVEWKAFAQLGKVAWRVRMERSRGCRRLLLNVSF
jgi:hypothetical protein